MKWKGRMAEFTSAHETYKTTTCKPAGGQARARERQTERQNEVVGWGGKAGVWWGWEIASIYVLGKKDATDVSSKRYSQVPVTD